MEIDDCIGADRPNRVSKDLISSSKAPGRLIQNGVARDRVSLAVFRVVPPVVAGDTPLIANVVIHAIGEVEIVGGLDQALQIVVGVVVADSGIIRIKEVSKKRSRNRIESARRNLVPGKSSPGYSPITGDDGAEGVVNYTERSIGGTRLREVALAF